MYGFRLPLPLPLLLLETPDEDDAADRGVEGVVAAEGTCCCLTTTTLLLGLDADGDGLLPLLGLP